MNKFQLLKSFIVAFAILSVFSCTKESPEVIIPFDKKVIVINQGNFTEHSASISIYDESTGAIENRVFESANGVSIGATVISGAIAPNRQAYLICNNPDKIEIIDSRTAKVASDPIINGLASPRDAVITRDRIYVTNWDYDYVVNSIGFWEFINSYVAVYDAFTGNLIKKVKVGTDAEGILLYGDKLFVAVKEGVRVLDITNDNFDVLATIRPASVTGGAKHFAIDKNGSLWASFPDKGVVQIDPRNMSVLSVAEVPVDSMDGYITSDDKGENIYTYHTIFDSNYMAQESSVYRVDISNAIITKLFSGNYFYGVGVSPSTGNIFTAEVNFTSNSLIKIFSKSGALQATATSGVGTSRYLFF